MKKTVLITGASSGIGAATARAVVAVGGRAILLARSADKLEALCAELGQASLAAPGDVTSDSDIEAAVAAGTRKFGAVDAAFVNAGMFMQSLLADGDTAQWEKMVDVNIMGAARTIRAVLPQMLARKSGDILLTGSTAGKGVFPNGAMYAATKHAVYAIAEGLRREVSPSGIRVGVVSPGYVANEIWGYTDSEASRRAADTGEALMSEDIAAMVVHILSLPQHVNIADVMVAPTRRDFPSY